MPRPTDVFYAKDYHPLQAGSIDGTDIVPHDHGVYRAMIASETGLYDPTGDCKAVGDPYCTIFVSRLSRNTTEETLREAMSKYGKIKSMRLVRHIVTGASRGYAFVEFENERDYLHAYETAHDTVIDGSHILVDYNRQQLMRGWIPRRLGGGLGGRKESGQLRFGGRDRPFRVPLRDEVPYEELKKLGIPVTPERYMSRYEIPPPPRRPSEDRKRSLTDREHTSRRSSEDHHREHTSRRSSEDHREHSSRKSSEDRKRQQDKSDGDREHTSRSSEDRREHTSRRSSEDHREHSSKRSSKDRKRQRDESDGDREQTSRSSEDRREHTSRRSSEDHREHSSKRSSKDRKRQRDESVGEDEHRSQKSRDRQTRHSGIVGQRGG